MYVVIFLDISACCSHTIQGWLNEQLEKEGLELISVTGGYFIFKKLSYTLDECERGG